ncbi:MAG TPA: phospholipase D family protein [Lysobacter sp.]|nr:phospholipase D family protein [Lysobacter sp.]
MNALRRALLGAAALLLSACATLSPRQVEQIEARVQQVRPQTLDCSAIDHCATPSPLRELAARAFAESQPQRPRHYALILDRGTDALLARVNLIRSATTSIDIQTYIFDEDDSSRLVLDELLAAARRGVRVRLLVDQLAALQRVDTLAALAAAHANFELRLYNPVLGRARISYWQYLVAGACCFRKLNQRMHTKLLLVDGAIGITGGRNYQDDYFDWNPEYDFRDRDLLVAGPEVAAMAADFARFWDDRRSVPVQRLADVGRRLLHADVPALAPHAYAWPERAATLRREAGDPAVVGQRLAGAALPIGAVRYISDSPRKHEDAGHTGASAELRRLIESAQEEVLLQTPYLVLSKNAQQMFRGLRKRADPPRVIVSTNSLAATDAFIVYALSYKYKRRYLREFGFTIYEYKPFPADAPIDLAATGAHRQMRPAPSAEYVNTDRRSVLYRTRYRTPLSREHVATRYRSRAAHERVPLQRAGVRIGLHAKSLVVDERVGVVGTHNFDPRGDLYNTESAVVIADPAFARALADSIRRDIAPANSWVIARRDKLPVLSGLDYSVGKVAEALPVFDFWPARYATSYEFVPGPDCPHPPFPDQPEFRRCHRPVGDFPEVALGWKSVMTRIVTAFGAGLAPIL